MLPFCEPGDTDTRIWRNGGFSRCFATITGSLSSSGVLIIFGIATIVLCSNDKNNNGKGNKKKNWRQFMSSKAFIFEIVSSTSLALSFLAELLIKILMENGSHFYGYNIVTCTTSLVSWLFSLLVIYKERLSSYFGLSHSLPLVLFWLLNVVWLSLSVMSWSSSEWWWGLDDKIDKADLILFCIRLALLLVLCTVSVVRPLIVFKKRRNYRLIINEIETETETEDETPTKQSQGSEDPSKSGSFERKSSQGSTFGDFVKKAKLIFPYVWPKGHYVLQLVVVICFLILASGRVINLYVPIYYKKIVNGLTPQKNMTDSLDLAYGVTVNNTGITFPLASILIYVGLRFLQGGAVGSMGFANNLRTFLWIKVQQYTSRAMQVRLFSHLHSLSLRWHLGRKTGEVLRVMDRGTNSINNLLSYVLFNILPTIVDIAIAVVYFIIAFDVWFGLIVFTTMISYLLFTISITEWRTKYRRIMNEMDNQVKAKGVDSLLNFETVKYYGHEDFEVERFKEAILNYQGAEWESLASLNLLNSGQNLIITSGLLVGSMLCAYRVYQGVLSVGDFVLFATYIIQLYAPLNFFGTYYRLIQQAFIDMENMFDLLEVSQEISDDPNAPPLQINDGCIEFRRVYFHYNPEKPILKDLSFTVQAGETVALVGTSGAGKSTIIRLLFRFYDIQDGEIFIDGQNIRHVRQSSLRQKLGVVPQDTVLFNDDIRYNIRYGKIEATDEEVEEAASYADMDERIKSFPQQYKTLVGERGLKLSGGEKQRVAIARTILKNPMIILLDEATSALDTQTERNIQNSLMRVCQGRTTIIVAHRLSTIIHANQILVLREGEVCERGTHESLLSMGGVYSNMWRQQQRSLEEEEGMGSVGLVTENVDTLL